MAPIVIEIHGSGFEDIHHVAHSWKVRLNHCFADAPYRARILLAWGSRDVRALVTDEKKQIFFVCADDDEYPDVKRRLQTLGSIVIRR